jgi:RNA polymerase sigma factor (sigma-70 family)
LRFITEKQPEPGPEDQPLSLEEYRLWKDFKNGDSNAYALIYQKYFFVLFQYGKRITSDQELVKDTIQDLFIKIWNNRNNLKETTSIRYYLLTSLKRKLLDVLRSSQVRLEFGNERIDHVLLAAVEEAEEDYPFVQKEKVLKALDKLSEHQQKLICMKFYRNLSNQEIAEEMGITIQSVYNSVFKVLKKLRTQWPVLVAFIFHLNASG